MCFVHVTTDTRGTKIYPFQHFKDKASPASVGKCWIAFGFVVYHTLVQSSAKTPTLSLAKSTISPPIKPCSSTCQRKWTWQQNLWLSRTTTPRMINITISDNAMEPAGGYSCSTSGSLFGETKDFSGRFLAVLEFTTVAVSLDVTFVILHFVRFEVLQAKLVDRNFVVMFCAKCCWTRQSEKDTSCKHNRTIASFIFSRPSRFPI